MVAPVCKWPHQQLRNGRAHRDGLPATMKNSQWLTTWSAYSDHMWWRIHEQYANTHNQQSTMHKGQYWAKYNGAYRDGSYVIMINKWKCIQEYIVSSCNNWLSFSKQGNRDNQQLTSVCANTDSMWAPILNTQQCLQGQCAQQPWSATNNAHRDNMLATMRNN